MASLKKSVMFSDATCNFIRDRNKAEDEIMWSRELNEGFKALSWLTRQSLPDLAVADWEVILNVYAGSWIEFQPPFRIASDIMDHFGVVDINDLDPELRLQVVRLHGLSQPQQYAIMEFVRVFWSHDWSHTKDFKEVIWQIKEML